MKMTPPNKPTTAELEILAALWEHSPATVREIYETINKRKPTKYTTVLKFMQIMFEKGLVERDDSRKAHVFKAKQPRSETQGNLVGDLLEKAFRGSALSLVQHVLETKPASRADLDAIRQMIDEAEAKGVK